MDKAISFLFLLIYTSSFGQYSIKGKITNENGENLDYAIVYLENTKFAGATDRSGTYVIENVPNGKYIAKCTFLGYNASQQEIQITNKNIELNFILTGSLFQLDKVEISANRVNPNQGFTYSMLYKDEIQKQNVGQDVPYLLNYTPSAVTTSDAGTGIGYTGLRIRGTDPTRTNVTINDVPLNDSESQGVYWVDLPDILSSTKDIQIVRGVGSSTNGSGAFGATVSLNTMENRVNSYADLNATYGSFNTKKLSINLGTGLMNNRYTVDGRYSIIKSDGYVDRASADLKSWYFSAARLGDKSSLRLIAFSGKERTYQSWNGAPESVVNQNSELMMQHYLRNKGSIYRNDADSINLFDSGRTYNYYTYPNQVDDYSQSHYQLHLSRALSEKITLRSSLFYTKGKGFFEEEKLGESLSRYGLDPWPSNTGDSIYEADFIRRRWLDNDYYGVNVSLRYLPTATSKLSFSASYTNYKGSHFGDLIDSKPEITLLNSQYYKSIASKNDKSAFVRYETLAGRFGVHGEMQVRSINYSTNGTDNDLREFSIHESYNFLNPKLGFTYGASKNHKLYASLAIANKEPNRSDFLDRTELTKPLSERLYNVELGYKISRNTWNAQANLYYMLYKDQLVLTGALNDSGSAIRSNVAHSDRLGLEVEANIQITDRLSIHANIAVSRNKIRNFEEVIYDYTNGVGGIKIEHENSNISFSPSIVAGNNLNYKITSQLSLDIFSKFVSGQYLDNTQDESRKLLQYSFHNLAIYYQLPQHAIRNIKLIGGINNFTNRLFSTNGYSYTYVYGEKITENFLYPQAGTHGYISIQAGF